MFKLIRNVLAVALAASLSTSLLARDFRSAEVHPPDYPTTQAVQYMGKLLSEQTKGRLNIRVYASGSLGTATATRFWTSTWAASRSVPVLKVTVIVTLPSPVDWLDW